MRSIKQVTNFRAVRFTLSGAVNTAVNFTILNAAFYSLHLSKFVSIIIATACAIGVSFMLNRNYVFRDKDRPVKKLPRFVAVSVLGVFIIQNSVYGLCVLLLHNHEFGVIDAIQQLSSVHLSSSFVDINFSNAIASFAVLFWNYNGYKLFVFNGKRQGNEVIEDTGTETA
jgi:putative flippase GtrA